MQRPLILGSSSNSRKILLQRLGLPFSCMSPDIDENPRQNELPPNLACRLAFEKALAIAQQKPNALIIGADTLAYHQDELLQKPGNYDAARKQLSRLSGEAVVFYTGLCLFNSGNGQHQLALEPTTVHFRQLSANAIDYYLQQDQPFNAVGSFKVDQLGISLFRKIETNDINGLVGLPLIKLVDMLHHEGVDVLSSVYS